MGKLMLSLAVVSGLVCGVSAAELPYDCELEYLTVAKGVHFDTGVQVTSAPTARVKFALQGGSTMDVFGTTEAVDGCFILNHESSHLYYRYGTSANAGKSSNAVQTDVVYDFVCAQDILSDAEKLKKAYVSLKVMSAKGTAWFDDVVLEEMPYVEGRSH